MHKRFYWLGIVAAIAYVNAVIIGGFLVPNYSHINQAISEIEPLLDYSNNKYIITSLFTVYNVSALLLGISLFNLLKEKGKKYQFQAISIFLISLFGLLMYFFPMDIIGEPITILGIIHIILASLMAPLTVMATLLGFWTFKENKAMRWYSLITSGVILGCGATTAYLTANEMEWMGLFERITIGSYIIFLFITSLYWHHYLKGEKK